MAYDKPYATPSTFSPLEVCILAAENKVSGHFSFDVDVFQTKGLLGRTIHKTPCIVFRHGSICVCLAGV